MKALHVVMMGLGLVAAGISRKAVNEEVVTRVTVIERIEDEEGLSHVIYLDGEGNRWASDCVEQWMVVLRFGNNRGIYID